MFIKMDDELYHMSPSLNNTCIKSVKFLACKWPLTSLFWLQQKKGGRKGWKDLYEWFPTCFAWCVNLIGSHSTHGCSPLHKSCTFFLQIIVQIECELKTSCYINHFCWCTWKTYFVTLFLHVTPSLEIFKINMMWYMILFT
jgi:hypothetical protein